MTRRRRRSPSSDGRRGGAAALAGVVPVAALIALGVVTAGRDAWAQACCAGGSVVAPTRLATYEDFAIGLQTRAQGAMGSFGADGRYLPSQTSSEQSFEQQLLASVRLARAAQTGVVLRALSTHRNASGIDEWGGGLGDVTLTARYDFILPAERPRMPGLAVLAAATLPTGTPPDRATQPLATDATGAGSFDASLGLSVEKAGSHVFGMLALWGTQRAGRSVSLPGAPSVTQSFGLRWTVLATAGWVFESEAAVALFATAFDEGDPTINGVRDGAAGRRLTTVGAAGAVPFAAAWRVQGTAFADVTVASLGRNQPAGAGATLSLVRVWY